MKPPVVNFFSQALDNCNQLLELEPDSKWTLYTRVLILLAIDSQANHKVKTEQCDAQRLNRLSAMLVPIILN